MQTDLLDRELPGLATALDPTAMAPAIAATLRRDPEERWRLLGVELLGHKPGRRCALAYTAEGPEGRRRLFAKLFADDRGARIHEDLTRLARVVIHQRDVEMPRPLAYLAPIRLLLSEYVEGRRLAPDLYSGESEAPARRLAAATAALHRCEYLPAGLWGPRQELERTRGSVSGMGRNGSLGTRVRVVLEKLDGGVDAVAEAAETAGASTSYLHRRLTAERFRDSEGSTVVMGLDRGRVGDPALDLGGFLAALRVRSLQFPERVRGARHSAAAFLRAYRARMSSSNGADFDRRVRFYETASLLRLAGSCSRSERWAVALPPLLVEACEELAPQV